MQITQYGHHGDAMTAFADALDAATPEFPVVFLFLDDFDLATEIEPHNVSLLRNHLQLDTFKPSFFGDLGEKVIARAAIIADGLPHGNGALTLDFTAKQADWLFALYAGSMYDNSFQASFNHALFVGLWLTWETNEFEVDVLYNPTLGEGWLSNETEGTAGAWAAFEMDIDGNPDPSETVGYRIRRLNERLTCQVLQYDPISQKVTVTNDADS